MFNSHKARIVVNVIVLFEIVGGGADVHSAAIHRYEFLYICGYVSLCC